MEKETITAAVMGALVVGAGVAGALAFDAKGDAADSAAKLATQADTLEAAEQEAVVLGFFKFSITISLNIILFFKILICSIRSSISGLKLLMINQNLLIKVFIMLQ